MKLPRYQKYRDSGVKWLGEVPEHWEISVLKRMAHTELSNVDKKTADGEASVSLCNYLDVYRNEKITVDLDFMVASASDEQISRLSLQQGDVIITKDSESPDDIGVPAFVSDDLSQVVCGYHLALIRPYTREADGLYIARALRSEFLRAQFSTSAVGMTRFGLGKYEIENAILPKPPRKEQRRIAEFLDHQLGTIDALTEEQENLIELLTEKRQAIISHAVTKGLDPNVAMKPSGNDWHGLVPASWKPVSLRRAIIRIEQGWSPVAEDRAPDENEWAVLKLSAVKGGNFNGCCVKTLGSDEDVDVRLCVQDGDFLLTRANTPELVGDTCIVSSAPPRTIFSDLIYRIVTIKEELIPEYLNLYLQSDAGRTQIQRDARGSSQSMVKLSHHLIKNWFIPLPSLEEQHNIIRAVESRLEKLDGLIVEANSTITLLNERRSALISAAVTGQIDVRGGSSGVQ